MIYVETQGYRPSAWRMLKYAMKDWGRSNDDGTGIAWQKGESIYTLKDKFEAARFFKAMDFSPHASKLLGHVRAGTNGSVTRQNAHPFQSCTGKSVFMHNGIVTNYIALKRELIAKGHKFTSETDSEIILHMAEEVGPEKVMGELAKRGVRGSANWVWFTPVKTFAFSDGSLWLVENQKGLRVGLFSDLAPFGKRFFRHAKELKQGTLVTIENGKVTEMKDVGTIPAGYAVTYVGCDEFGRYGRIRSFRGAREVIYPYSQETNSGFVNMSNDDEWERMLQEDSPKAYEAERQLSPKAQAAERALADAAGIRAGPPFSDGNAESVARMFGQVNAEEFKERLNGENPFGLRRKPGREPEITVGNGVDVEDEDYARAMQAFLKGKAREEREDAWRRQRELEEGNDVERKMSDAGLVGPLQDDIGDPTSDDEVRPGDYYCRRCDQIVREPNLAGEEPRCRDCYGQLFLIDDLVNIKPGISVR